MSSWASRGSPQAPLGSFTQKSLKGIQATTPSSAKSLVKNGFLDTTGGRKMRVGAGEAQQHSLPK